MAVLREGAIITTIAYKDGIIAYDSRATRGNLIATDNYDKCAKADGVLFFFSGAAGDVRHLVDAYLKGVTPPKEADIYAIVVDQGVVYRAGTDGGLFWKEKASAYDAIGSGYAHALTAMDCGLSAIEAVKMAAKRDTGTGGKIRHYKVK